MMRDLNRDWRSAGLALLPLVSTLLLVLSSGALAGTLIPSVIAPPLMLVAIFFWTLHRPDLMPIGVAFALGLLQDLVSGTPLGVWTVSATLASAMTTNQARALATRPFVIVWTAFLLVATVATVVAWALVSLAVWSSPPASPVIGQLLVLFGAYPLIALPFGRLQQLTLERG